MRRGKRRSSGPCPLLSLGQAAAQPAAQHSHSPLFLAQQTALFHLTNMDSQRRSPAAVPRLLALSQAVAKHPTFCSERKLALANRNIGEIDRVAGRFWAVETLYLSGNYIDNITALEQFGRVRKLALAGNRIPNFEALEPIRGLLGLQWLSLEDNPVASKPLYREKVLHMLKQLSTLDGIAIFDQERGNAAITIEQFRRVSALVVSNEAEIAKLRHIIRLMSLNQQLFRLQKLDFAPFSGRKLQEMMQVDWPQSTKVLIEAEFTAKMQTILRGNAGKDWAWASAQQLLSQQEDLAKLQTQLEALGKQLEAATAPAQPVIPAISLQKLHSRKAALEGVKGNIVSRRSPVPATPLPTLSSPRSFAPLPSPKPAETAELRQIRKENEILRTQVVELKGAQVLHSRKEELARYQSQVEALVERNSALQRELERTQTRLEVANTRADIVVSSVQGQTKPPNALFTLTRKVMSRKLGKRTLQVWRNQVEIRKRRREIAEKVQQLGKRGTKAGFFALWKQTLAIHRFKTSVFTKNSYAISRNFLSFLRSRANLSHRIAILQFSHSRKLLQSSFSALYTQKLAGPADRAKENKAFEAYLRWLKRRVVLGLRKRLESWGNEWEIEQKWVEKAERHWKQRVKAEIWGKWQEWRHRFGSKGRYKVLQALSHYAFTLKSLLFTGLRTCQRASARTQAEAEFLREKSLLKQAGKWLLTVKNRQKRRQIKEIEAQLALKQWAKQRFQWVKLATQLRKSSRHIHSSLLSIQRLKAERKHFRLLAAHRDYCRRCTLASTAVDARTRFSALRHSLFAWMQALRRPVSAGERKRSEFGQTLLRKWREIARSRRRKGLLGKVGNGLYAKKVTAGLRNVIWVWKLHISKRKRDKIVAEMVEKRGNKHKINTFYLIWRLNFLSFLHAKASEAQITANSKVKSFLEAQSALSDLQEDFDLMQNQHKSLQEQYYALSVMQNRYIEDENALKFDLDSRNKQISVLETALQACESQKMSESAAFQAEIKQLKSSITTLLQDLHSQAEATETQAAQLAFLAQQHRGKEQESRLQLETLSCQCAELRTQAQARETALREAQEACRLLSEELGRRRGGERDTGLERLIEEQTAIRAELTALLQRKERLGSQGSDGSRTNR